MSSTVTFGDLNFGSQIGINYGSINLNFDEKLPIVNEAVFDSFKDQHEDKCLPGTRTEILLRIRDWAFSTQGKCIFWLNGMAGTGKSTISRTVAASFNETKALGASFFFKRGETDRGNALKLFPTIARQLVISIPQLLPNIRQAVQNDPGIAMKAMKQQFDNLLLQPLRSLKPSDLSIRTVVIVIDALDECERDDDIRLILQFLPQLQTVRSIRVRVFLTSRPELPIRLGFSKIATCDHTDLVLHEIPERVIEHDISLFLKQRLSEIRTDRSLPVGWPGDTAIKSLVEISVPLFIFAATICRIFGDPHWDPVDSLAKILAHRNDGSQFDRTYLPALNRLLQGQSKKQKKQLVREFQEILSIIVMLESPLSVISLSRFLGLTEEHIDRRLSSLHAVLMVPSDPTKPVRLFHLSFRDFLLDPETRDRTPFWVDKKQTQQRLAARCLHLCGTLRKNMCQLNHDTKRAAIDRQTIDRYLPPELQYSCRYWAHHLTQSENPIAGIDDVLSFFWNHFLNWMEAMSILGWVSEIVGVINSLQSILLDEMSPEVSQFLHDAKRFTRRFSKIIDETPLQVYSSALIFAPKMATIRRQFDAEIPACISRLPEVEETWSAELQTLEGHDDSVWCVVFSPNGRILASGSEDTTVRLWDTTTGALQHTLESHSDWVRCIAFSPDGRLLASGSNDETVRLWDTATGTLRHILEGHSNWVRCIVFSIDGRVVMSSSDDMTIKLWNIPSGAPRQTFEGHSDSIWCLAVAHDGRSLASGSDDQTIKLWNTDLGALHLTLKGHTSWIRSVAFSPDGYSLASGSGDKTVKLWDTTTGALRRTLKGHSASIWSVSFCPGGRLASVSEDKTVCLWNTHTGAVEQTFEGHAGPIFSVAFSPNGQILASGSYDMTLKLWDTNARTLSQTVTAHTSLVTSMTFSPDGKLLASGSSDKKIKLWNTTTGTLQQTLEGHSKLVRFVTFSPNGQLLASSSDDETLKVWNLVRGTLDHTLNSHSGWVCSHLFSHDGGLVAFIQKKDTVILFDIVTGAHKHSLEGHSDWVRSMVFSPDDQLLASGSSDMRILLWNTLTGSCEQALVGHIDAITSLVFSSDGVLLASSSQDQTIRLWSVTCGTPLHVLTTFATPVWSVALSPNSRLLASSLQDGTVQLWDVFSGTFQLLLDAGEVITKLEFSPDGHHLFTNMGSLNIKAWRDTGMTRAIFDIFVWDGQWVMVNDKKVLRLPHEYRPGCMAFKDNLAALGHASGRISFIGFRHIEHQ